MADFCKQCSFDMFRQDFGDLAHITELDDWINGIAATVICEGCGCIQVDPYGNCVSNCLHSDKPGHNCPWIGEQQ